MRDYFDTPSAWQNRFSVLEYLEEEQEFRAQYVAETRAFMDRWSIAGATRQVLTWASMLTRTTMLTGMKRPRAIMRMTITMVGASTIVTWLHIGLP